MQLSTPTLVVGVTCGELTSKTSLVFVLRKFRDETSLEEDKTIVLPPSKRKSDHYSLPNSENEFAGGHACTLIYFKAVVRRELAGAEGGGGALLS